MNKIAIAVCFFACGFCLAGAISGGPEWLYVLAVVNFGFGITNLIVGWNA